MTNQIISNDDVLVTGGGRGIGKAIVKQLAATGYNVTFTFSKSESDAEKLTDELKQKYPEQTFSARKTNLASRQEVDQLASELSEGDAFYGFIHNAGLSYDALAALMEQDRAEDLMQVNFWAMSRLAGAILRPMMSARRGRIVGIGSITFKHGVTGNAAYAASKGAMMSYIKTLAIEAARRGICANYIAPGFVDTDLLAPYQNYREKMELQIPLRRFAKPEEIAGLVDFLLSPPAGYITGSVIPMDGGLDAALPIQR